MQSITTALSTTATTIADNALSAIGTVLPTVAPIFAAIVVISITYKVMSGLVIVMGFPSLI